MIGCECADCQNAMLANGALAQYFFLDETPTFAPVTRWHGKGAPCLIKHQRRGDRIHAVDVHVLEEGAVAWGPTGPVFGALASCGERVLDVEVIDTQRVSTDLRYCSECLVGHYFVVYLCWGEAGQPLYIGQTKNVHQRLRQHRWLAEASRVELRFVTSRREALALEAELIAEHEPERNIHHRHRRFRAV
jgi:hypothetical protein